MNKTIKTDLGNKDVFIKNLSRCLSRSQKSQRELAKAIGVHPATICDWLSGRTYPRMNKLQLIADFFEISKSELVEENYVPQDSISIEDQEVLDWFHKVPKEKREFVLSMIQAASNNL